MGIETYASPGLRWGLLLEDHPKATHDFDMKDGKDLGVPDSYGGGGKFCVCTLRIPGQEPLVAYKPVKGRGEPDEWVVACTKTLGRALKKAGYPDDLKDLKALVLWRQRDAEITAIRNGAGIDALGSGGKVEEAIAEIEAAPPTHAGDDGDIDVIEHDDTDDAPASRDDLDSEVVDAEIVDDSPEVPTEKAQALNVELWEQLAAEVANLPSKDAKDFNDFCGKQGISTDSNAWTNEDLIEIDAWFSGN